MANSNEEILQVISLFRHGARETFINLDNNELYSADLREDSIINTINKGKHFVDKYFNIFSPSPFNENDLKCYISDTSRTIKTIIYRFSDFVPQDDFKVMKQKELKEFTLKYFPNAIYNDKIYKSFEYSNKIAYKYFKTDPDYKQLLNELDSEIGKKSQSALELYKKYYNKINSQRPNLDNYIITFIYDFLFYVKPEVQKSFSEDQLIIKEVMRKINANKRMMDINSSNPNVLLCYIHQLLNSYYEELIKVKENAADKKKIVLYSAHDIYLTCLVSFLGVNKSKYNYGFDDEINLIIFKKPNDEKLYVKFEYNDDLMEIPFSTLESKTECELDTLLNKIKNEYLFCSYQDIQDFCYQKNTKEFYPSE